MVIYLINVHITVCIIHFYPFLFYRTRGLLSGCWTNYLALICNNRDQDHWRLGGSFQSTKWLPWNPEPNRSPGHLNCHHPEELHNPSPQNCEVRKAVCPLHIHFLHPTLGPIFLNEEDNLNGLLLRSEFGTLQYPLPSQV